MAKRRWYCLACTAPYEVQLKLDYPHTHLTAKPSKKGRRK